MRSTTPGVNFTPRPDLSEPDELVVEVSIDASAFLAAMEATAGAIRAFGEALSRRDPEVVRAMSEIAEHARQTAPPRTGVLARAASQGVCTVAELRAALDGAGLPLSMARTVADLTCQGMAAQRAAATLAGVRNAYGGDLPADFAGVWMRDIDDDQLRLHIAAAGSTGAEAGRRLQEWVLRAAPTYGTTVPPEQVDDGQAHDYDPDQCWKCDAKPGVEELDGACWRCWYKLTGTTKAPA